MRLLRRKRPKNRVLETAREALEAVRHVRRETVRKAGLVAGGVAALTAGSAAVSSRRRRTESQE